MHRLRAILAARRFARFARSNGLVYFGRVHRDDEHTPIGGFTVSTSQTDDGYMTGSIHGQSLTLVRRTVAHTGHGRAALHTWLIAAVNPNDASPSHCLLLSHEHPRDVIEAAALHADRAERLTIHPELDARFLIFGHRADSERIQMYVDSEMVTFLCSHPEYDYKFCNGLIYVYRRTAVTDVATLTGLVQTALTLAHNTDRH